MHVTQQLKYVQAIAPADVDGATATAIPIDTLEYDELALIISLGVMDDALTTLKLVESDVVGSGYTDVDGADFSSDGTLPLSTNDGLVDAVFLNLQHRKRFIKVVLTAGATGVGVFVSVLGILARAHQTPSDAATRGLNQELIVIS